MQYCNTCAIKKGLIRVKNRTRAGCDFCGKITLCFMVKDGVNKGVDVGIRKATE